MKGEGSAEWREDLEDRLEAMNIGIHWEHMVNCNVNETYQIVNDHSWKN